MAERPIVADLLPVLEPAQVLLIERRGWLSWLIRRTTHSRYSHATLIDRTESGILVTVEAADLRGVQALRMERFLEDPGVTGLLLRDSTALTPWERQAVMRAAWLRVGRRYDGWQLVSIWLRRRLPWLFGGRKKALAANRFDSKDRLICSELVVVSFLEGAKLNLAPPHVAAGNVDPGHLAATPKLATLWRWP